MSKNNGHPKGDPMMQHFDFFTDDGADDHWIAFTLNDKGKVDKSLSVSASALTLFSYGLRQVARTIYDDAKVSK